ncbi:phosphoglucosamine mutase [Rubidibacter lacunae KORDI 51-2]|uniref:Phosphoglucosamine mutase n=1 Tax=Rubidibacter lacunae KORDI 51-2 TaxID=582515 RepID=U5DKK6_9CHRO|nr:phosphoglucosamine mutase [Rubidibacter lacunae]ERN41084.1 phosphoglucosamine mutase [Rubidibacter lacunae KORDI 51-2]
MVVSPLQNGRSSHVKLDERDAHAFSNMATTTWGTVALPDGSLFGTDGIRGSAGELLSAPLALAIGFWAGQTFRAAAGTAGAVVVGQDSRNSSDMLAMSLAAGLTSAGLEVWNVGLCPTPCVAHLSAHTEAIAGIAISASHNPPGDNGIKFFGRDGMKLSSALAAEIENGIRHGVAPAAGAWGKFQSRPELVREYVTALQAGLPCNIDLSGQTVVLDLAWGAAVAIGASLFEALGAEVVCLHDRADGDRINVGCGSTDLQVLQAAVQGHRAQFGFAFDGDADRVLAVDERGRAVDGDCMLYLWGKALKARGLLPDNLLIATVMANLGFERAWTDIGGTMTRTPVGDRYVQAQMWEMGAMLGGEQSGHLICRHYSHTGDGLLAALHLACLVQDTGATLGELRDASFQPYPQVLKNVRVEDVQRRRNWQQCTALTEAIAHAEAEMGVGGRVLVRASGTEPVLRVMVEAHTDRLARKWSDRLVQIARDRLVV